MHCGGPLLTAATSTSPCSPGPWVPMGPAEGGDPESAEATERDHTDGGAGGWAAWCLQRPLSFLGRSGEAWHQMHWKTLPWIMILWVVCTWLCCGSQTVRSHDLFWVLLESLKHSTHTNLEFMSRAW